MNKRLAKKIAQSSRQYSKRQQQKADNLFLRWFASFVKVGAVVGVGETPATIVNNRVDRGSGGRLWPAVKCKLPSGRVIRVPVDWLRPLENTT